MTLTKKHNLCLYKYTNEQLLEILEENQITDTHVLSCICSEVLRRMHREKPILTEKCIWLEDAQPD